MKYLFLITGVLLAILAYLTPFITQGSDPDTKVIFWMTDNNPARNLQIDLYNEWRESKDKKTVNMAVDSANNSQQKKIIHGVTGVMSDIVDVSTPSELRLYQLMGLTLDLTPYAKKRGFSMEDTYPLLGSSLSVGGKQRSYPANVVSLGWYVNRKALEKVGIGDLPETSTWKDLEKIGIEYVAKANRGLERRKYFFHNSYPWFMRTGWRSFGVDHLNETMTGGAFDREGWIKYFEMRERWRDELHLVPTAAEEASFSTDQGYGGSMLQLFNAGYYATIQGGRWLQIQFRQFSDMDYYLIREPYSVFPNTQISARSVFVYQGGKNVEVAIDFLAYLSSEEYNMNIVEDADGLPPNPKYLDHPEYLNPSDYPMESQPNQLFADLAKTVGVPLVDSPYLRPGSEKNYWSKPYDKWNSYQATYEEILLEMQNEVDRQIQDWIVEETALQPEFKKDLENQKIIDKLRKAGEPIPRELIKSDFWLRYYEQVGMLK